MSLTPGYGETPLLDDELESLLPEVRALIEGEATKAAVFDLEQGVEDIVKEALTSAAVEGNLTLDELLTDRFVCELHKRLYGDIWTWAGRYRFRELNIGIAPEHIPSQVRESLGNIQYRWEFTDDWSPRQLGISVHAELVRIHPFVDGNGRSTRVLADLVFIAAQDGPDIEQYDWSLNKPDYIRLLKAYDKHRDSRDLAASIAVEPFTD
jgi:fido (protein-threonine AMPylation protein)